MRGKGYVEIVDVHVAGITPAYAGKSFRCLLLRRPCRDHPRICGEKGFLLRPCLAGSGSPPHMRGKGVQASNEVITVGITPAYAGKSVSSATKT